MSRNIFADGASERRDDSYPYKVPDDEVGPMKTRRVNAADLYP